MPIGFPVNVATILFLSLVLLGCGGGGGGSAATGPNAVTVFLADKDADGILELYVGDDSGAEPSKLSGVMVAGGQVDRFFVSPDLQYVAYVADQDIDGVNELYVASVANGNPVKVSGALVAGGAVFNVYWAPDSSRVAYSADQDTDGIVELYSVLPDGSGNTKVSGTMIAGGSLRMTAVAWAPDSSRLAYIADQDTDGVDELYTVFPDGTGNIKVSGPQTPGGDVGANTLGPTLLRWAPDSSRIAYIADQDADDVRELYTTLPDSAAGNVKVSGALVANGEVDFTYLWSPDSSSIAYLADQDTDEVDELYLSAADGGTNSKISDTLVAGGDVILCAWAPNANLIAYLADGDTDDVRELYVTDPAGAAVKVSGVLVTGGAVEFDFRWAPDGSRIAYRADQLTDEVTELFTSLPDGSENVRVSAAMIAEGDVGGDSFISNTSMFWAPDSSRIAYVADGNTNGVFEMYLAQPDGGGSSKISGAVKGSGLNLESIFNGVSVGWTADSQHLVYRAEQDSSSVLELYGVNRDGSGNTKISGTMATNGDVGRFVVAE